MSASEAALIDLQPGPSIHGLLDASETSPSSLPSPLGKPPSCETSSASNNSSSRSLSTTDSEDEGWGEVEQLLIDVSALSKTRKSINCEEEKEASSLSLAHALLARPSDLLSREETALLWAQREGLVQDGRALVKLLRAVLAYGPLEGSVDVDGAGLIGMWATAGCGLTAVDAMKLLGRHVLDPTIRASAIQQLGRLEDDELQLYLLQMVQLLRYEPWGAGESSSDSLEEAFPPPAVAPPARPLPPMNMPPLARFLIDRACTGSLELANAFFWFLAAEMQTDRALGRAFEAVRFAFLYTLREHSEPTYAALSAQEHWIKRVFRVYRRVLAAPGLRERKQALLRELLAEEGLARPPLPSVPLPLDPALRATSLDPASATVYGSKTYPVFISFALKGDDQCEGGETGAAAAAVAPAGIVPALEASRELEEEEAAGIASVASPSTKVLIFKIREDVRQDQLVLQLLRVMDGLLKAEGLDLCLTAYRVLATGQQEGIVEHVPGAVTIADVMASTRSSTNDGGSGSRILAFLQRHRPSARDPLGVEPAVMDTYIRSLAGNCVITHLLGIGDRHLHNIMLCPDGRVLHIDFGFILGRDPKQPVPRGPFRLSPAMVDGMGGREHPNFALFKRLCVDAFKCLRRHARLLIGLVDLMADANLKDICAAPSSPAAPPLTTPASGSSSLGALDRSQSLSQSSSLSQQPPQHPDAARALARMEGWFRLDLGEEEVEQHFVGLIHKALGALGPQVVDVLHNLASQVK